MSEGTIVFDDAPELVTEGGESERSSVLLDGGREHMVVDGQVVRQARELDVEGELVVIDSPTARSQTLEGEPDFFLMDPPPVPANVVTEEGAPAGLVLQSGGRQGAPGPEGPAGPAGSDGAGSYYQEFGFAAPSTVWTLVHNRESFGLNVEAVDVNGDPLEGVVDFVDQNTIHIHWYYPTAGTARLFR